MIVESIAYFVLRASVYLLIIAAGYFILLRKSPQASFNRVFILVSVIGSLLLAFIPADQIVMVPDSGLLAFNLPEIVITATGNVSTKATLIGHALISFTPIYYLFMAGSFLALLVMVIRFIQIGILIRRHNGYSLNDMVVINLDSQTGPFSFFRWIFIPKGLDNEYHFAAILAHERAHFKQRHSADVLFFELIKVLFWYHPAYYFLRSELRAMHEYEADKIVLNRFDKIEYQKTLVSLSFSGGLIPITNPFNVSLIKKRMLMMNKKSKHQPVKKWLFITVISLSVGLTAIIQSCDFRKSAETDSNVEQQLIETPVETTAVAADTTTSEIYTVVEPMPEFNGGVKAMNKFLSENINYPENAKRNNIQGTVYVSFIIEKDGGVSSVKILRGIGGGCDEEAFRVVNMMPDWIPGKLNGQNVRVSFNLPVRFKLQ